MCNIEALPQLLFFSLENPSNRAVLCTTKILLHFSHMMAIDIQLCANVDGTQGTTRQAQFHGLFVQHKEQHRLLIETGHQRKHQMDRWT